jgi:hypothetical protein
MKSFKYSLISLLMLFLTLGPAWHSCRAQTTVINGIEYQQISDFETDSFINTMKISADGTRIVFATSGPAVQVYTINSDGTGLTQIYDFQRTGTGPFVDISADGNKVIWCIGYGEIFIANADGSEREELATLLPNPIPDAADIEPTIPLPPRITADGNQVFFIHMGHNPLASGVWQVNSDGSSLTQLFHYIELSEELFGKDGSEYNRNIAYTSGFDISGDGSRMIFGTAILKIEENDIVRGDAIVFDGMTFRNLGDYAMGIQPFATYQDGDQFIMFKREYNDSLAFDEINIYFVPIGTGDPVQVISGLDIFGGSEMTQMAGDGSRAIVMGGNGRLPIALVDRLSASRLDLVSMDGISRAISGFNFSQSSFPSITSDGNRFCFLAHSIPPQIWVADIVSDGINSQPSISEVSFDPDFVLIDGSTTSTFKAHVTSPPDSIHTVTIEAFKDGAQQFRGIAADYTPFYPELVDDGTLGDETAGDGYYCNNTVRADLPETPIGSYTIRLVAVNSTLKEITMVDAEPFSILEQTTSIKEPVSLATEFRLYQNYPNPFNPTTIINYELPITNYVELSIYNLLGQKVTILVSERQKAGHHQVEWDASGFSSGIYYYRIEAGEFQDVKKMVLLK